MNKALIGYTGYVGGTLQKQTSFIEFFRSSNIPDISRVNVDTIVCAGAPAKKWIANSDPVSDLRAINALIDPLRAARCNTFILISTVDVFRDAIHVDEDSPVIESGLSPYGLHRRLLEKFVESNFDNHLIVRLPGLVGPGLKKNVIFDFLNHNNLESVDSRGIFQFYPMVNLWHDIQIALRNRLKLVHLTSAPVTVADVAEQGFGLPFNHQLARTPARYDFRSKYAEAFGGTGGYHYSDRETMLAIRAYAQSEPHMTIDSNGKLR
jgi:dTDP-4-dehydrorhamnose reductase